MSTPREHERRLAWSIDEAAQALGVSRDHFERHIVPEIRLVYSGRRQLVPIVELERWVDDSAVATRATANGFRNRQRS